MKKTILALMLAATAAWAAPAPYPVTINSRSATAPPLTAYRASKHVYRVEFTDGATASTVTSAVPFMTWSTNATATTVSTSAYAFVSGTTGKVDFTFLPADVNYAPGRYIYEVGLLNSDVPYMYRQGVFTILGSPYSAGGTATAFTTAVNWTLISASGNLDFGGGYVTNVTFGGTMSHGALSGLTADDHVRYGTLADAETIAGNWVNTAYPWADNEVADTLTIGAGSTIAAGALPDTYLPLTAGTGKRITGDLYLDKGTNNSPDLLFLDGSGESATIRKTDGGSFSLYNGASQIDLYRASAMFGLNGGILTNGTFASDWDLPSAQLSGTISTARLPADGYASTYLNATGDTVTVGNLIMGPKAGGSSVSTVYSTTNKTASIFLQDGGALVASSGQGLWLKAFGSNVWVTGGVNVGGTNAVDDGDLRVEGTISGDSILLGTNSGTRTVSADKGGIIAGKNAGSQTNSGYGANISGYNDGTQIASGDGAMILGYAGFGTTQTVSGVGSVLLSNGGSASITGAESLGLGAVTVTHAQSIVAGDGQVSHGNGSITAGGGFYGTGDTVITNGHLWVHNDATNELTLKVVAPTNTAANQVVAGVYSGATALMVVDAEGDVGVGTATPVTQLNVYEETLADVRIHAGANGTAQFSFMEGTPTVDPSKDGFKIKYDGANNALKIHAVENSADYETRGITILRATPGNVGIGTNAPRVKLDVPFGAIASGYTLSLTNGPTQLDSLDVSKKNYIYVDSTANAVTVGGLAGGVAGQSMTFVHIAGTNTVTLMHVEGSSSQHIYFTGETDEAIPLYGNRALFCSGAAWYGNSL